MYSNYVFIRNTVVYLLQHKTIILLLLYFMFLLGPNTHHSLCYYILADTRTISASSMFSASCECNNLQESDHMQSWWYSGNQGVL